MKDTVLNCLWLEEPQNHSASSLMMCEDDELFLLFSCPPPGSGHPPALYFSSFRPTSFRLRGWQAEELRTNSIRLSVHVCPGTAAGGCSGPLSGFLPSATLTLITNRDTLTRLCQTCILRELRPPLPPSLQLSPHCSHLCLRVFLHCFPVSPALSDFAEDLTWKPTCQTDADWWINLSPAGEHIFLCPGASVASDIRSQLLRLQ